MEELAKSRDQDIETRIEAARSIMERHFIVSNWRIWSDLILAVLFACLAIGYRVDAPALSLAQMFVAGGSLYDALNKLASRSVAKQCLAMIDGRKAGTVEENRTARKPSE